MRSFIYIIVMESKTSFDALPQHSHSFTHTHKHTHTHTASYSDILAGAIFLVNHNAPKDKDKHSETKRKSA